ncbi:MAG TPA: hypothetical protein VKO84_01370 [Gaiellaceae bacterium]|nr:hypothetical protein [Gaiellaceae bacterium]
MKLLGGGVALALALLSSASAANTQKGVPAPRGNTQGLALLRQVHAAYLHVPAAQTRARIGAESEHFTLVLQAGITTAEQFVAIGPSGSIVLVARRGGPTYAREAGTTCWRRLAQSNPQTLEDVGLRFPDDYRMFVKAPRRAGAAWLLPVAGSGRYPDEKGTFTFHINANTMLVQSEVSHISGHTLTNHVKALNRAPRLTTPTPTC